MRSIKQIFLEITSTDAIPADGGYTMPDDVVRAWNASLDYDREMKRKFSYFDVAFKSRGVTRGHRGHLTRAHRKLLATIKDNGLEANETIKKLFQLYPPKHF